MECWKWDTLELLIFFCCGKCINDRMEGLFVFWNAFMQLPLVLVVMVVFCRFDVVWKNKTIGQMQVSIFFFFSFDFFRSA